PDRIRELDHVRRDGLHPLLRGLERARLAAVRLVHDQGVLLHLPGDVDPVDAAPGPYRPADGHRLEGASSPLPGEPGVYRDLRPLALTGASCAADVRAARSHQES